MSVSTIGSSIGAPATPKTPVASAPKTLGSADFMQLLAVQFQNQDPMKPMDDTAFIAQMAQFTTLQQTQTMTSVMTTLSSSQALAAANSFLGHQVTVNNGNNGPVTGLVSAVQVDPANGPQLMVGGQPYPVSSVVLVQPAPATPSSTTSTTVPASAGGS